MEPEDYVVLLSPFVPYGECWEFKNVPLLMVNDRWAEEQVNRLDAELMRSMGIQWSPDGQGQAAAQV